METIDALVLERPSSIHMMGIGGAGMSGLARLLKELGHTVSGCDVASAAKEKVSSVDVAIGHSPSHMDDFSPDILAYTSAIDANHPEIEAARDKGIKVVKRAQLLSGIFNVRTGIGVAGTHGKTTTSSMISLIADEAGVCPTVAIGGELCDIGCNAMLGTGDIMVAELDESDGSFELFAPQVAVITNIDWDHVDYYPTFEHVKSAFRRFVDGRKKGGYCVVCGEDGGTEDIIKSLDPEFLHTYGWGTSWVWGATDVVALAGGGMECKVYYRSSCLGKMRLKVSGEHNILNALAACAAAHISGIPFEVSCIALYRFSGAKRRMQYVGGGCGFDIFDDYGHHPREISATLDSVRGSYPDRRIVALFQPHRYTRTAAMSEAFANALSKAHITLLLPVYGADESPIEGVSSNLIASHFKENGSSKLVSCDDFADAMKKVEKHAENGDLFITLGAGDVCRLGSQILKLLNTDRGVTGGAA